MSQISTANFEVRIYPSRTEGAVKATASVTINGFFAVNNIRVVDGSKGLFVAMPQLKGRNGEYKDICFPCTKDAKAALDQAVLSAFEQTMAQRSGQAQGYGQSM